MDYKEFQDIMSSMDYASYKLECAYTENEGEVTEETEMLEAEITALRTLLNTEGVDFLGRWLKGKEDKKKAIKAEKDYLTRQIEAIDKNIEFIKAKIRELMDATGCEKVKGSLGYSFATATSTKTEVDKDILCDHYQSIVDEALKDILPDDVTVTLSASVSKLADDAELPDYYHRTETPTIRFTKPRGSKE
jgi:hypothetical protein